MEPETHTQPSDGLLLGGEAPQSTPVIMEVEEENGCGVLKQQPAGEEVVVCAEGVPSPVEQAKLIEELKSKIDLA